MAHRLQLPLEEDCLHHPLQATLHLFHHLRAWMQQRVRVVSLLLLRVREMVPPLLHLQEPMSLELLPLLPLLSRYL